MILDERTEFADATALQTADFSTDTVTGDVIDLGGTTNYPGDGEPMYCVILVSTAVTSAGAATVTFALRSDSTANLATSPTTHLLTAAIAKATLVAGYEVACFALPSGPYERYLGVMHLPGTADLTAGAVNAFLVKDPHQWRAYADAL